jgi:hypothetical protein
MPDHQIDDDAIAVNPMLGVDLVVRHDVSDPRDDAS